MCKRLLARAAFGAVTFIGLLGTGLQVPQWVLELSPLTAVGNPRHGDIDASALAWLTLAALALMAAGFGAFQNRRVPQG